MSYGLFKINGRGAAGFVLVTTATESISMNDELIEVAEYSFRELMIMQEAAGSALGMGSLSPGSNIGISDELEVIIIKNDN